MQVCFFCGAANSPGNKECHSCGHAMPGNEDATPEVAPEGEPTDFECPYCAHIVPAGEVQCGHCEAVVVSNDPLDKPAPKTHDSDITDRYDEFAHQVEGLRTGRVAFADFSSWFSSVQGTLMAKRDGYVALIRDGGYYEVNSDEVDMGLTGIFDFETAMEMIEEFITGAAEQSQLDEALRLMWEATEKVNEAMRMNRDFRNGLDDDWGYV